MGYLKADTSRVDVDIVTTAAGVVTYPGGSAKGRVWVLPDKTVVVRVPGVDKSIQRLIFEDVKSATWERPKSTLTVILANGDKITANVRQGGCCGLGLAAQAGPIDGQYQTHRVSGIDWYQG